MSLTWHLRDLQRSDVPSLLQIEEELNAFPWNERNFLDSLDAGHLGRCMLVNDTIAGFAIVSLAVAEATLLNIGIARRHQREGLGKALLQAMLEIATERGAETCFLEVRASNHVAHGLYHATGFYEVGHRRDYYPAKRGREDAVLMNLPLTEVTEM